MNKGTYYATGWVYRDNGKRRTMVLRKDSINGVNLSFEKIDKDDRNIKRLVVVDKQPATDKNRDWNFFYSGAGGGEKSNVWAQSVEFRCEPCETGTYNSKLTFKDTVTNRIFTIDFSVTVMPLPE
jgi:hypothetical protein